MRASKYLVGIAVAAVVAAFGIAVTGSSVRAADTAEATYKGKCAACHGPDGKGETTMGKMLKVHDFASEEVKKMTDAELEDAISKGKGKMPAYKSFTPEQVKGLVAFVRGFAKKG